jgi:hypothetical protein
MRSHIKQSVRHDLLDLREARVKKLLVVVLASGQQHGSIIIVARETLFRPRGVTDRDYLPNLQHMFGGHE